jgi:uncharacterized membrane protein YkoI
MIVPRPDRTLNGSGRRQHTRTPWSPQGSRDQEVIVKSSRKLLITAAAAVVLGTAGAGIAAASGGSDSTEGPDVPISGDALQKASDAALASTGGGRVTGTEIHDEESYYEVEVTLGDGNQVDVQLDESFTVVGSTTDSGD